jgi:hypothetical protein
MLLAALAIAAPGCTIYTQEPGHVASDGSIYLGWNLFTGKKADRESYAVGQKLGPYSSIRLHADEASTVSEVTVIFADGERFAAPAPGAMTEGQWTNPIALPGGARPLHSIVVGAQSQTKRLAKIEIYGTR